MKTRKTVLVYMDKRENGVTKNGISICGYERDMETGNNVFLIVE